MSYSRTAENYRSDNRNHISLRLAEKEIENNFYRSKFNTNNNQYDSQRKRRLLTPENCIKTLNNTAKSPLNTRDLSLESAEYARGKLIGKGGFAKCYKAIHSRTNKIYAIKTIDEEILKDEDKLK